MDSAVRPDSYSLGHTGSAGFNPSYGDAPDKGVKRHNTGRFEVLDVSRDYPHLT